MLWSRDDKTWSNLLLFKSERWSNVAWRYIHTIDIQRCVTVYTYYRYSTLRDGICILSIFNVAWRYIHTIDIQRCVTVYTYYRYSAWLRRTLPTGYWDVTAGKPTGTLSRPSKAGSLVALSRLSQERCRWTNGCKCRCRFCRTCICRCRFINSMK